MKAGSGKAKGGAFERLIAKRLSLWWSHGEKDDIFYRTASSGGRATQRTKRGKSTHGQYGDLQAVDVIGQPLMDLCVIECKDGYASDSIADLLDKEPRHNPKYEQFIRQAQNSGNESDALYWILIARRRGRQIMLYLPEIFWIELKQVYLDSLVIRPSALINVGKGKSFACFQLESFLKAVTPERVLKI